MDGESSGTVIRGGAVSMIALYILLRILRVQTFCFYDLVYPL